jgi:hypothetical protein
VLQRRTASTVFAGEKQMAKFIYDLRNTQGRIERLDNVIAVAPRDLPTSYKHESR